MLVAPGPPIDPNAYSNLDVLGTVRSIGPWWRLLLAGLDPAVADVRPTSGGPMFAELAAEQATRLTDTLHRLGATTGHAGRVDIEQLADEVHRMTAGRLARPDIRSALDDLLVRSLALLRLAGRSLAETGAFGEPRFGEVHGLFTSNGGVPKLAVESIEVQTDGVVGDRQKTRRHHGRPWQALCLWSVESVQRLAAQGHPIEPGAAGENVSVSGLDWAAVRPGTRLRLGASVVAELSVFALPCRQNARWFVNGDFMQMHHDRGPGISRIYASVLQGGRVELGDRVDLLP
ncbi:MAG: MOSC domain-containing protein [Actinomycetota bacterium]|nr:MOSC domain-containing protein [Actinomycetota bacterium]